MKIRGSLLVTKDIKLLNPGGSTPSEGLVALSDSEGNIHWGHLAALPLDLLYIYPKAGTLAIHLGKLYFSVVENALGSLFEDADVWTDVTGTSGDTLPQDIIDALNAANEPSTSNPIATQADIQNLSVKGTDTASNILLKSFVVKNNLWISSTVGEDSFETIVQIGDGLISTGSAWLSIGPFRGPAGDQGGIGDDGPPGPAGIGIILQGTTTVENIVIRDPTVFGTLWIASNTGVDSNLAAVAVGDGLMANGTGWQNVGPIRGPAGVAAFVGTYLIKGGATWLYDYTFLVTADQYVIGGLLYSAIPAIMTLTPADPLLDRVDSFVADAFGTIFIQEGISSNPAVLPEINESLLVKISHTLVTKNTTEPVGVTTNAIFDENLGIAGGEFDAVVATNNGATIDLNSTGQYSGTKCIKVLNGRNEIINFTPAAPIVFSTSFSGLTMRVKSLNSTLKVNVTVRLYKNGSKVANALLLDAFGFNYKNTLDWQLVTMSLSSFAPYAPDFDMLSIVFEDPTFAGKSDIMFDAITYQAGIYVEPGQLPIEYTSQLINNGEGDTPFLTVDSLNFALLATAPAAPFKFVQKGFGNVNLQQYEIGDIFCGWTNDGTIRYTEAEWLGGVLTDSDNFKPLVQTQLDDVIVPARKHNSKFNIKFN